MPEKPRLVLDTNVLVSRLLIRNSISAQAVRHAMNGFQPLISTETIMELRTVLSRPKFMQYLDISDKMSFLHHLEQTCVLVQHVPAVKACRDPKDDKFLALAVAGRASLILSGDDDLLKLHPFRGIAILSPRQYLDGWSS